MGITHGGDGNGGIEMWVYAASDRATCPDTRRSTSGRGRDQLADPGDYRGRYFGGDVHGTFGDC